MDFLAPDFDGEKVLRWASNQAPDTKQAVLKQFRIWKAIKDSLGSIQRPHFEEKKRAELVLKPFIPSEKNDAFFRSNAKIRWASGSNRSGKSEIGSRDCISYLLGFRPWYPNSDPAFRTPNSLPAKGLFMSEDWKAAKRIVHEKIYQLVPKELIVGKLRKNQEGIEAFWKIKVPFDATGKESILELSTYNTDTRSIANWQGDFAWFDEPCPREHWVTVKRGLVDRNGHAWFTFTQLTEPWMEDEIIDNPESEGVYMTMYDNLWNPLTGSGGLTEEGVNQFMQGLSSEEIQVRVYGKSPKLFGRILREFNRDIHVIPGDIIKKEFEIPKFWPRMVFLDTHPRKPHNVLFVAWDLGNRRMYVYDSFRYGEPEYAGNFGDLIAGVSVDEFKAEIKDRCKIWPKAFFVDPLAKEPDQTSGKSLYDSLLEDFPVQTWEKVRDKKNAIHHLRQMMIPDPATGMPHFFVFGSQDRVVYELERYRWDEFRGVSKGKNDPKGQPVKKEDDYVDCCIMASIHTPEELIDDSVSEDEEPEVWFKY